MILYPLSFFRNIWRILGDPFGEIWLERTLWGDPFGEVHSGRSDQGDRFGRSLLGDSFGDIGLGKSVQGYLLWEIHSGRSVWGDPFGDIPLGRSVWGDPFGEICLGRSVWEDQFKDANVWKFVQAGAFEQKLDFCKFKTRLTSLQSTLTILHLLKKCTKTMSSAEASKKAPNPHHRLFKASQKSLPINFSEHGGLLASCGLQYDIPIKCHGNCTVKIYR